MSLKYPKNVIWFVRATSRNGSVCEGSAVAIRLQDVVVDESGAKRPDPNAARTYLLTYAHVVRERSSDRKEGYGPVVPDGNIGAWMPDTGLTQDQHKTMKIKADLRAIDVHDLQPPRRTNPPDDWVILEFLDHQTALAADARW